MRLCTAVILVLTGCLPDPDIHVPDFSLPYLSVDLSTPPPPVDMGSDMAGHMGWMAGPPAGSTNDLRSVWVSDANLGAVYIAGHNGTILRSAGGAAFVSETSTTTNNLYAVIGLSTDEAFAAGAGGIVLHRMAGQWMKEASGLTTNDLYSLAMPATGEIYAVGLGGTVLHRSGGNWALEGTPGTTDLRGVAGRGASDVFAVGDHVIWHRGAATWAADTATVAAADQGYNYAVTVVDGTMYLAGDGARVLRRDDANGKWVAEATVKPAMNPPTLDGIYGTGGEILAVGAGGVIQHRTGGATPTWATETSGTAKDLYAVHGASVHAALAVGAAGTVLRRY